MQNKKTIIDLLAIKNTLNQISVCGEENLDRLLGCIQKTKSMIAEEEQHADDHAE